MSRRKQSNPKPTLKGEEEEDCWVAGGESPRGGGARQEVQAPAMPTTATADGEGMDEEGGKGAAAPVGRQPGAGAEQEGERGPKREEEGAAGSGPQEEQGGPHEAQDGGESAESDRRTKELIVKKEEMVEEDEEELVEEEDVSRRGENSEEGEASPPPAAPAASMPLSSQEDEDSPAPGARPPSLGSPEVVAVPSSPPVATPSHRGGLRLNASLVTDPSGGRGPSISEAHLPPPHPRLADLEYLLPPGLHPSTAAAAAAAAFAAAASRIICFPPHPATPRAAPTHTTPPPPHAEPPPAPVAPASRPPPVGPAKAEASPVRQVAVFVCAPCGIKFSSASTLQAHQTYYCSHRNSALGPSPGDEAPSAPARPPTSSPTAHATAQDGQQPPTAIRSSAMPSGAAVRARSGGSESEDGGRPCSAEAEKRRSPASEEGCPPAKAPRASRPFPCPHCSYSADKKVSLNRHMRMHGGAGVIVNSAASSASTSPSSDTTPPPVPPPPPLLLAPAPPTPQLLAPPPPPQLLDPAPPPPSSSSLSSSSTAPLLSVPTQLHHLLQQGVVVVPGSSSPRGQDVTPPGTSSPDPSLPPLALDRYCQQCDIRFSSVKTYRAHKQHYCSTRHSSGQGKQSSCPEGPSDGDRSPGASATAPPSSLPSTVPPQPPLQVKQHLLKPPFVALPTSPVLLVPYAFLQSASLVVAGTPTPKGACILLPDGSTRPLSPPPPTAGPQGHSTANRRTPPEPPAPPPPPLAVTPQQSVTPKSKEDDSQYAKTPPLPQPGSSPASPLDLSSRRDSLSESQDSRTNSQHSSTISNRRFLKQTLERGDESFQETIMPVLTRQQELGWRPSADPKAPTGGPQSPPSPSQQSSADCHAHSPASSTSSSAASSSPVAKARPSRPNGMSKGPPPPPQSNPPLFPASNPPPALPPHLQQQFSSGMDQGSLGMANLFLAACAAAATAATSGPDGMAKAVAAVAAGAAGNAAVQGALPFLLSPELALRMFMGSMAAGLPPPECLRPGPPHIVPPPLTPPQPTPPPAPQEVLVKQGVSKCVECNIVFCRKENFLAHKRHYCAARLVAEGAVADASPQGAAASPSSAQGGAGAERQRGAEVSDHSSEPSSSPRAASMASSSPQGGQVPGAVAPPPPKTLLQFICVACGIKFTSFDNLQAHQTYYCLKRDPGPQKGTLSPADVALPAERALRKCPKCKISLPEEALLRHQCTNGCGPSPGGANAAGWKCPCCDVLSPTASAAQRHLETHAGGAVRAFRCTYCGYRGNTLRGMRTHIRAHFETQVPHSPQELQEENFIACILEDELEVAPMVPVVAVAAPAAPRSATPTTDSDDAASSAAGGDRMHYCEVCGYSSTYKGNVVRHLKLVHKCPHPGGGATEEGGVLGPGVALVKGEGSNSSVTPSPGPPGAEDPSSALVMNGYGHGMREGDEEEEEVDEEDDGEVRAESLVKVEMREVEDEKGVKGESDEESPAVAIKREVLSPSGEEDGGNSWGGRCSSSTPIQEVPSKNVVKREAEDLTTSCAKEQREGEGEAKTDGRGHSPGAAVGQQTATNRTKMDPKHCRSCDITFNYLPSFIAHKKFYCSSHHPSNGAQRGRISPRAVRGVEGVGHSGNGKAEAATPVQ